MNRLVKAYKIVAVFVVLAIILGIYAVALYDIQIVSSDKYTTSAVDTTSVNYTINASRGDVLDRNGVLLVSSRPAYNIIISRSELLNTDDPNAVLFGIISSAEEFDVNYNDEFPLTITAPFSYPAQMTSTQRTRHEKYLEFFDLDPNISAADFFVWMKNHYGLDYTTSITDARKIMGVRYALELRVIMNIPEYVFANDVSAEFIADLMQKEYTGVHVETDQAREIHTEYAAHLLGYTGEMSPDEYEIYKELDYPMDAVIGKSGVEAAFEEYLHGTDGKVRVTTDDEGSVVDQEYISDPVAGSNVFLTIDIKLQAAAEKALQDVIAEINASFEEDEDKARGGAVVVTDVNTGEELAMASYPTFNLKTWREDWNIIEQNELNPMFNRATQGIYNPGSTFKMVTALAGLRTEKITEHKYVLDEGRYTRYAPSYQPKCWVYPEGTHGEVNIISALGNSCNYFFYWLGDMMGVDAITAAAQEFGLGSKTGLEIPEKAGSLATPDFKEEATGDKWYAADTLITAIGQGYTQLTPVQIANYAATIANGGTLYKTTILKEVDNYNYTEKLFENTPEVKNEIEDAEAYIPLLQTGMRAVASTGTAASIFANYPIKIACKTGTVQSDASTTNTGVFVCYAPADNPEIAISVVVENGISGSTVMAIAQRILDYYFEETERMDLVKEENTLLK